MSGWALGCVAADEGCLHKLHELFFGLVHHLGRDGGGASLFGQPLDLATGHGPDEVGDVGQPLANIPNAVERGDRRPPRRLRARHSRVSR